MKQIIKTTLALIVFLSGTSVSAHQPDISSFTLFEQESGQWMLQVNASLTAFQYEVESRYGKEAYTSPEEFNQLLLNHLRTQTTLQINGEDVTLDNGIVKLGHATSVLFELSGVPVTVEEVFVKNNSFEHIRNSQVIFSIIKEGFDKSRFALSNANDYQLHVSLKDNQVLLAKTEWLFNLTTLASILLFIGLAGFILHKSRFMTTTKKLALD